MHDQYLNVSQKAIEKYEIHIPLSTSKWFYTKCILLYHYEWRALYKLHKDLSASYLPILCKLNHHLYITEAGHYSYKSPRQISLPHHHNQYRHVNIVQNILVITPENKGME